MLDVRCANVRIEFRIEITRWPDLESQREGRDEMSLFVAVLGQRS